MGLFSKLLSSRSAGTPALKACMEALAQDGGPEARERFFRTLLRSRLVVPSPRFQANGHCSVGRDFDVVEARAHDGSRGMAVFTDEPALLMWHPAGAPYSVLPIADVCGKALAAQLTSLVFNPGSPITGYVSRYELLALAEGRIPPQLRENQAIQAASIQLRLPDQEIPAPFREVLNKVGPTLMDVRAIWILAMTIERGESHPCVIIEHRPGANPDAFVPRIMMPIQDLLRSGSYIDCLPMPSGSELLQQAKAISLPIFATEKSAEG